MKRNLLPEQRCKVICPATWASPKRRCPFAAKDDGMCGTHLRSAQLKLGRDLDDRYRIRQLQSGYDELRKICNRQQADLAAAAAELPQVAGPIANRIRVYRQSYEEQITAVREQAQASAKDAERYRWLREQGNPSDGRDTICVMWRDRYGTAYPTGAFLDTAIDAALAAGATPGKTDSAPDPSSAADPARNG